MERNKLRWLVGPQSEQWAAFKQIEMRSFIAAGTGDAGGGAGGMCLVACPGADCGNFLLNEEPELMREVRCDQDGGCGMSFCSLCREPWHRHGTTCEEARQIRTDWLSWIATGRQEYQRQLGQEAADVNAQAAADAAASLANMRQDEEWKAANCRHCPSCNRVVNHMGGCDAMVCGRNYHGGDVQDGCGASFNWSSAKRYKASVDRAAAAQVAVRAEDLVRGEHEGIRCMLCGVEPIVGPRFECLHCRSTVEGRFNACINCEPRLHEPGAHPAGHCFQPIMPPNAGDAAAFAARVGAGGGGGGALAREGSGEHCAVM